MKKLFAILCLICFTFTMTACGSKKTEPEPEPEPVVEEVIVLSPEYEEGSEKAELQLAIANLVLDNYKSTDIDSISLNVDYGTEVEGDYVAIVNLVWNVKNSADTTKKMLKMYSDDLAARLYKEQPAIQEVAVFWEIPYQKGTAKFSYERADGGMAIGDATTSGF